MHFSFRHGKLDTYHSYNLSTPTIQSVLILRTLHDACMFVVDISVLYHNGNYGNMLWSQQSMHWQHGISLPLPRCETEVISPQLTAVTFSSMSWKGERNCKKKLRPEHRCMRKSVSLNFRGRQDPRQWIVRVDQNLLERWPNAKIEGFPHNRPQHDLAEKVHKRLHTGSALASMLAGISFHDMETMSFCQKASQLTLPCVGSIPEWLSKALQPPARHGYCGTEIHGQ